MKTIDYKDLVYSIELSYLLMDLYRMRYSKPLSEAQADKLDWMANKVEEALEKAHKCEITILSQSQTIMQLKSENEHFMDQLKLMIAESERSEELQEVANRYFELKKPG